MLLYSRIVRLSCCCKMQSAWALGVCGIPKLLFNSWFKSNFNSWFKSILQFLIQFKSSILDSNQFFNSWFKSILQFLIQINSSSLDSNQISILDSNQFFNSWFKSNFNSSRPILSDWNGGRKFWIERDGCEWQWQPGCLQNCLFLFNALDSFQSWALAVFFVVFL